MSLVADGLPSNQRLSAVIAISVGIGMATLDTAIVNTALPTLAEGIGTDSASVIWVVNAYQLATIAAVLPFASLSDVLGHRRVFLGGLLVFIVASLFCGLAWSLPTLTAARVVQGLGAAAIMSVNIALLRHIYPAKILGRGLGYNSLVVGLAFTLGPTAASAILSVTTWHWLYLINVPLGLLAFVLGVRSLPTIPMTGHAFDRFAALLCAGLFALLVFGLGEAVHGAGALLTLSLIGVALVCGLLLIRRQAGHPAPMLAVDLFKRPLFTLSALTAICAFSAQGLAFVSLPFLLQTVLGHSQVATGFLMTPWPAGVAVMALIAGRLADAGHTHRASLLAMLFAALSFLPAFVHPLYSVIGLAVTGVVLDFCVQMNMVLGQRAIYALDANSRSRLNALYMTSIFIGGAFGSAIASSVYEHGGWLGVMLVGSAFPLVALLRFLSASRQVTVATA